MPLRCSIALILIISAQKCASWNSSTNGSLIRDPRQAIILFTPGIKGEILQPGNSASKSVHTPSGYGPAVLQDRRANIWPNHALKDDPRFTTTKKPELENRRRIGNKRGRGPGRQRGKSRNKLSQVEQIIVDEHIFIHYMQHMRCLENFNVTIGCLLCTCMSTGSSFMCLTQRNVVCKWSNYRADLQPGVPNFNCTPNALVRDPLISIWCQNCYCAEDGVSVICTFERTTNCVHREITATTVSELYLSGAEDLSDSDAMLPDADSVPSTRRRMMNSKKKIPVHRRTNPAKTDQQSTKN